MAVVMMPMVVMVPVVPAVMMTPMTVVPVAMVAPVAMMPAAVPYDVDGRDLIRGRRDAGAEAGGRRRRELRRGKQQRRPGQNDQNEFAHALLRCARPLGQEALPGLNSI
jgi:hypothetical protein